jgi:hypothetical protein
MWQRYAQPTAAAVRGAKSPNRPVAHTHTLARTLDVVGHGGSAHQQRERREGIEHAARRHCAFSDGWMMAATPARSTHARAQAHARTQKMVDDWVVG